MLIWRRTMKTFSALSHRIHLEFLRLQLSRMKKPGHGSRPKHQGRISNSGRKPCLNVQRYCIFFDRNRSTCVNFGPEWNGVFF